MACPQSMLLLHKYTISNMLLQNFQDGKLTTAQKHNENHVNIYKAK